jgi:hypothetical protein
MTISEFLGMVIPKGISSLDITSMLVMYVILKVLKEVEKSAFSKAFTIAVNKILGRKETKLEDIVIADNDVLKQEFETDNDILRDEVVGQVEDSLGQTTAVLIAHIRRLELKLDALEKKL